MIVAIWSVILPVSHQRIEIHFNSLEFPNSNVVPAIKSSAENKFFLALLGTLRQTFVCCMKSGHDHFPLHSIHHGVLTFGGTQYWLLSATSGVPHTNKKCAFPLHQPALQLSAYLHTNSRRHKMVK